MRTAAIVSAVLGAVGVCAEFNYSSLSLREAGARNTVDWRMWLLKDGNPISFWHDIPLYPDAKDDSIVNFYVEIPRWTDGKIETQRNEPLNPIFHDDKNKKPRFVYSVWPHKTYPFNYGSVPQTWENKNVKQQFTGFVGDNDPLDMFEISAIEPAYIGQVKQVKILGGLAMIDDNTTDWKAIAIDVRDPLAKLVNSVEELEKYRPGMVQTFYDWFKYYKVVKGDGLNTIIGNKFQNSTFMRDVIKESHGYWSDLVLNKAGDRGKIITKQTSNPRACKSYVASDQAVEKLGIPAKDNKLSAEKRPVEFDYWYYLDDKFELITLPGQ